MALTYAEGQGDTSAPAPALLGEERGNTISYRRSSVFIAVTCPSQIRTHVCSAGSAVWLWTWA